MLLSIGYQNGFINNFSKQNAENLDFPNDSSDYVLIKEALHHCPRPWLALHEAFRVCKKGVVFVEPCESLEYLKSPLGSIINLGGSFKRLLKSAIGVQDLQPLAPYYAFEEVGNYLFRFNKYDVEKFFMALQGQIIATWEYNMIYETGVELIKIPPESSQDLQRINRFMNKLKIFNMKSKLGLTSWNMLACVLFKIQPERDLVNDMRSSGWIIKNLPQNPYFTPDKLQQ